MLGLKLILDKPFDSRYGDLSDPVTMNLTTSMCSGVSYRLHYFLFNSIIILIYFSFIFIIIVSLLVFIQLVVRIQMGENQKTGVFTAR